MGKEIYNSQVKNEHGWDLQAEQTYLTFFLDVMEEKYLHIIQANTRYNAWKLNRRDRVHESEGLTHSFLKECFTPSITGTKAALDTMNPNERACGLIWHFFHQQEALLQAIHNPTEVGILAWLELAYCATL